MPAVKKPVEYPKCGNCPAAVPGAESTLPDGTKVPAFWCHRDPPVPSRTDTGGVRGDYPPVVAATIGCWSHPEWPKELRQPITEQNPRPPL